MEDPGPTQLDPLLGDVVDRLRESLSDAPIDWALTGSTSFALQGVPVEPNDVDVQTTESGAYEIERRFEDHVTEPVSFQSSEGIRSHFCGLSVDSVPVEIMGAVQKRRADGTWEPPVDIHTHTHTPAVRAVPRRSGPGPLTRLRGPGLRAARSERTGAAASGLHQLTSGEAAELEHISPTRLPSRGSSVGRTGPRSHRTDH